MSQCCLPDPNDNGLKERIEWDNISNRVRGVVVAYWKRNCLMNKITSIPQDSRQISFRYYVLSKPQVCRIHTLFSCFGLHESS